MSEAPPAEWPGTIVGARWKVQGLTCPPDVAEWLAERCMEASKREWARIVARW
jgi:hypothetical protein